MSATQTFEDRLNAKCVLGLRLFALIGIIVGVLLVLLFFSISFWISFRKRSRMMKLPTSNKQNSLKLCCRALQQPEYVTTSKPITQPVIELPTSSSGNVSEDRKTIEKEIVHIRQGSAETPSSAETPKTSLAAMKTAPETAKTTLESRFESSSNGTNTMEGLDGTSSFGCASSSPSEALVSHLGWGQWYCLKDLEVATGNFAESNIVGKGGYGIVYHGILADATHIAVKKLVNNRGQAEREFKVEVEAIGRVRHKNLVRLHGYCMQGAHRMLVYEFVDNGNLDQWLHGSLGEKNPMSWDTRMNILVGTAKGLAYLHEGLEPKVVHRDVKSSNILIDSQWNPKISDFGLAKLLGAENTHVTTRVMGTFGYVAPEYASTGLLNEKSDVYSYGVLLMEMITGRDPVDYNRPAGEVNLVDWLKVMVGSRRSTEVADPRMKVKPSQRSLKRALLVALRCVDPDALKRPKMSHVIQMIETDDNPFREERKSSCNIVPQARSNPNQFQTTLQNQSGSFYSPKHTGNKKEAFLRRLVGKDGSLQKEVPVESDPQIDNGSTDDLKAKWRIFED